MRLAARCAASGLLEAPAGGNGRWRLNAVRHGGGGAVLVSGPGRQSLGRAARDRDRRSRALVGRVRQARHDRGEPPVARSLWPATPAAGGVHGRAGAHAAPVPNAAAAIGLSPRPPSPIQGGLAAPRGCPFPREGATCQGVPRGAPLVFRAPRLRPRRPLCVPTHPFKEIVGVLPRRACNRSSPHTL